MRRRVGGQHRWGVVPETRWRRETRRPVRVVLEDGRYILVAEHRPGVCERVKRHGRFPSAPLVERKWVFEERGVERIEDGRRRGHEQMDLVDLVEQWAQCTGIPAPMRER